MPFAQFTCTLLRNKLAACLHCPLFLKRWRLASQVLQEARSLFIAHKDVRVGVQVQSVHTREAAAFKARLLPVPLISTHKHWHAFMWDLRAWALHALVCVRVDRQWLKSKGATNFWRRQKKAGSFCLRAYSPLMIPRLPSISDLCYLHSMNESDVLDAVATKTKSLVWNTISFGRSTNLFNPHPNRLQRDQTKQVLMHAISCKSLSSWGEAFTTAMYCIFCVPACCCCLRSCKWPPHSSAVCTTCLYLATVLVCRRYIWFQRMSMNILLTEPKEGWRVPSLGWLDACCLLLLLDAGGGADTF